MAYPGPLRGTRPRRRSSVATPKPRQTRERDPRLPAAGTVIVRTYKGKDHRVKVLEDSLKHEGEEYRSMTALARAVTGYSAISGPAWLGLTKGKAAVPKKNAATETAVVPATKRAAKVRRAGREPQDVATTEAPPAAETAAV